MSDVVVDDAPAMPAPVRAYRAIGMDVVVELPSRDPWPAVRAVSAAVVGVGAVVLAVVVAVTL